MEIVKAGNHKNDLVACQIQGHTSEALERLPIIPRSRMTKRSRTDGGTFCQETQKVPPD
jgi:hypothetical protein